MAVFTRLAITAPFSPVMEAWSGAPVPDQFIKGQTALVRQGAAVFQVKQCRNCHALGPEGGARGPALDEVAIRLTRDQLIRQVIQGGGNMPAYGKNLNPAEVTALVTFLETLHPPHIAPARDSRNRRFRRSHRVPARSLHSGRPWTHPLSRSRSSLPGVSTSC